MANQSSIVILPDFIANQIAAGEVVQRPENVVKELVENSLDSGANTITVIVKDSGKSLIHVIDNGAGMNSKDLALSTKRHATSKIRTQKDLESISSFGFRGEALASISSVARLEIITNSTEDRSNGLKLLSEPNREHTIEPMLSDKGTQILVRNLFYNVPARRKFLRSNITEFRHISDTMIKVALSNPELRIIFYDDETLIFDSRPNDLSATIKEVLGNSFAAGLLKIVDTIEDKDAHDNLHISGFVSELNSFRSTRTNQYLFLNRRPIKSKSIAHAIMTAYEPYLSRGQYPAYIININIDPKIIDINIHPQKHEVKFENEKRIYDKVLEIVSQTIDQGGFIPRMKPEDSSTIPAKLPHSVIDIEGKSILVNTNTGEIVPTEKNWTDKGEYQRYGSEKRNYSPRSPDFTRWDSNQENNTPGFGQTIGDLLYSDIQTTQPTSEAQRLFIADNIIVQFERSSLMVYSLKNINEAYVFRKMLNGNLLRGQDLMFPIEFLIEGIEHSRLSLIAEHLIELDIDCQLSEEGLFMVRSLPPELLTVSIEKAVEYSARSEFDPTKRNVAESLARHLPSRRKFNGDEINELLEFCGNNPDLNLSPNGKRLYKRLDSDNIASWF